MLLTVIAVATLLVAVVGATFAYFSLSVTGSANTTTANVSTGDIGSIAFDSGVKELTLSVAAQDMAKGLGENKYYFATTAEKGTQPSGGHWVEGIQGDEEKDKAPEDGVHEIAKVTLTGGEATDTYTCTNSTLKVTAAETPGKDMLAALSGNTGWVVLRLYGELLGPDHNTIEKAEEIDLSSLTENKTKDVTIPTIKLSASGTKTMDLKAELYLVNDQNADQSAIAGKGLTVTITFTPGTEEGNCTVSKTE